MANRQYLRHPLPLYRVFAALSFPLLLWGGYRLSVSRLNPLQSLYWNDYVRTTLPDMHFLHPFGDFGKLFGGQTQNTAAPKQDMQVMLSFSCNKGHDCLVTSSLIGTKLRASR